MEKPNLLETISDIARDKGLDRERVSHAVQEAITAAAKRKYAHFNEIETRIDPRSGEMEVFRFKRVTEVCTDPENEISLTEALAMDAQAQLDDEVEYEIDSMELRKVLAQTARQMIFQKIREVERQTIYERFKDRLGEVLNGVVSRMERGRVYITLNQTEAVLYPREQIPYERFASGDHVRVILLDVLDDPREFSPLVISRAHPQLLIKLFEMEVPEIYDGIVEIVNAAREPGRRAKVAVRSNDTDVDPVGACVGMRGSRVQSIVSELRGERVDIVQYSDELSTYLANAMSPAELSRVKVDDEERKIEVEVASEQLSLAIGRHGQNVRLASKLLDYEININSKGEQMSLEERIREGLMAVQGGEEEMPSAEVATEALDEATLPEAASSETGPPETGLPEAASMDALEQEQATETSGEQDAVAGDVEAEAESHVETLEQEQATETSGEQDAVAGDVEAEAASMDALEQEQATETSGEQDAVAEDVEAEAASMDALEQEQAAPEEVDQGPLSAAPNEAESSVEKSLE